MTIHQELHKRSTALGTCRDAINRQTEANRELERLFHYQAFRDYTVHSLADGRLILDNLRDLEAELVKQVAELEGVIL